MTGAEKLERDAEHAFHLGRPSVYDIRYDELVYLRDVILLNGNIYKAITDAFNAGYTRGAKAALRGHIPKSKLRRTRSE